MTHFIKTIVTGFILLFSVSNTQSQAVFTLEDVTAGVGSSFSMEVTAESLQNVFALQFSINWDPTILELQNIDNLNAAFSGMNINTTGSGSGVTTCSFFGGPVSMPDGDLLFELNFTVIGGSGGSTNVTFTGMPTNIEVSVIPGGNIGLVTQGGTVSLPQPLIFVMPDTIQNPGASFCLPVSVENFDNLFSIQSAINFDPSVITYDSVTNLNLSNLDPGSFSDVNASTGQLGFSWSDEDSLASGITVLDGTVIFEICFTVVGNVNDMTTVVFDDNPIPIEVIQGGSNDNLGLASQGGKINIQQTLFVTNSTLTQPNCNSFNGGSINISVAGGTGPYTYEWSNMSMDQDIDGLGVGTYTVTITDSSMPANTFIEIFSLLGDFTAPVADAGGLDTISCSEPTAILDGSGSSTGMDITYQWTHNGSATIINSDSLMPTVNALGFYTLLVTNTSNGCTDDDLAVVEGDVVPPIVDAGLPDTLKCNPTSLQLNGSVEPMGNYTYTWTEINGGTAPTNPTTLTPTVNAVGTYQLLVEEMGTGCSATDTVSIAINNVMPIADAGINRTLTCDSTTVVLDGSNSSMSDDITYQWVGPGTILPGNTAIATVNTTGTFTIEVLDNSNNCFATATVVVDENIDLPTAVAADMNAEINCTVNSVLLDGTGSSTGNNFTYLWTGANGGNVSNETTLSPTANAGGDYYLVVTDTINGCTASDTTSVTEDASIPTANAGDNRVINCNNIDSVQLDGSNSSLGGQYEYFWTASNGGNIVTDSVTGIAPYVNAAGTYTLLVTDTLSLCTSTSIVTVEVDTLPPLTNAVANGFLSCSQPKVLLFDEENIPSNDLIFSWTGPPAGICSATPEGGIIVNMVGEYCINITNTINGCEATSCVTVTENITPPTADAGSDFQIGCSPSTTTLDGSGSSTGTDYIYQWVALSGDDPTDDTTIAPTITSAGEYLIIVTDTINGCMSMDTVEVTLDDNYPIIEAGANGTITCNDPEIMLDASLVSSTGPEFTYSWVNGNGNTDGITDENTLTPTVDLPGLYILTITNTTNNCSSTDQLVVFTNNTPPVVVVAQDTVAFNCETTATLDATGSSLGSVEYLWKTTMGIIVAGGDSLVATVSQGGDFTFCVTNTSNGCTASADVFVSPKEPAGIPVVGFPDNITCNFPQVTLDATQSTILPNQIYEWTTGPNGNFVSGQTTLTPVVDKPAFYTFTIIDTITGCSYAGGGLVLADTNSVVVTGMEDSSITCQNDLINLEATVTTTSNNIAMGWTASMGANIISPDPTQLMIQGNSGGIYSFMAVDSITGCGDTIDIEVLTDTMPPIADAGMMMELPCSANSITLDGSGSSSGPNIQYLWTTDMNGNIITDPPTTDMVDVDDTGDYTLLVTNTTNGCTATSTVNVFSSQAVTATAIALEQLDCGVLSINLDGTGSTEGPTITYLWTPSMGGIIDNGETTLTPEVLAPGTYNLLVTDTQTGCTDDFDVVVEFNNPFPNANAGSDTTTCEDILSLNGNLPDNTTGLWLSLGSGIPTDPSDPSSEITNLEIGVNIFVWTLSAIGCPEYSSDTVIVLLENAPDAMDDSYTMEEGQVLNIDVGTNDNAVGGSFTLLSNVVNGVLVDNSGGTYSYTPNLEYIGPDEFQYELCAVACPDACDIATVSIFVNPAEPKPLDSLLNQKINTITPNEDGLNDNLVFDILIQNQGQYPIREFLVFNRWGNIVYETREYNNDWNGTNNNNKPLPEGTYYFILRLDVDAGVIIKGDVTILR